jgi:hypothetical protein
MKVQAGFNLIPLGGMYDPESAALLLDQTLAHKREVFLSLQGVGLLVVVVSPHLCGDTE